MTRPIDVRGDRLVSNPGVMVGSPGWYVWLGGRESFRYESSLGKFLAKLEQRRGGQFWYVYRRKDGLLRNLYLGKTEDLSLDVLQSAAQALSVSNEEWRSRPSGSKRKSYTTDNCSVTMSISGASEVTQSDSVVELLEDPRVVEAIGLLNESLKLKPNAGGAIKRKVRSALEALLTSK